MPGCVTHKGFRSIATQKEAFARMGDGPAKPPAVAPAKKNGSLPVRTDRVDDSPAPDLMLARPGSAR